MDDLRRDPLVVRKALLAKSDLASGSTSTWNSKTAYAPQVEALRRLRVFFGEQWRSCNTLTILKQRHTGERIAWLRNSAFGPIGGAS
jgi:hypothetical protein